MEKRSLRSKLAEIALGKSPIKKILSDPDTFHQFIEAKRALVYKSYTVPDSVDMRASTRKAETEEMPVYLLGSHDGQAAFSSEWHVFYLHGGGYVLHPSKIGWRFFNKLVGQTGWNVTVPIYPTVPNHHYEESFRKVLVQYKKLLQEVPTEKIVLMGDSAGGGFALALAQMLREEGLPQPGNLVLLSPWLDVTMSDLRQEELEKTDPILARYGGRKLGELWAGPRHDPRNPFVSPINGNLHGLAPITVFTGTHDLLLTDARNLKNRMTEEGIDLRYFEYPRMNHAFMLYPIPEADAAISQLISAVEFQVGILNST
ncbi:hypothetical protein B0X71_03655 [Planococcus lenghuensis]|uniref:Alpha/beta hydrolase fold-3 domain-containing protein n=1 Tax=Planococcus lenghuensis TaxID=2213202 RepID=A0A1Q2L3N1_9BACL|nr:hypothetical protein B0X71_03655 [Planococcus lenghuensis]